MNNPRHSPSSDEGYEMPEISLSGGVSSPTPFEPDTQRLTTIRPAQHPTVIDNTRNLAQSSDSDGFNAPGSTDDAAELLEPISPPPGYPPLDFRPLTLKNWFLCVIILFYTGCIAGLVVLMVFSHFDPQRLHMVHKTKQTAVQYIPGILGTLSIIGYKAIMTSYHRILPYAILSSETHAVRLRPNVMACYTGGFDEFGELLENGEYFTFYVIMVQILSVSTLTSLKNSIFTLTADSTGWSLTVSRGTGMLVVGIYALLLISLAGIVRRFWKAPTGLKWDPAPIASQLSLVYGSNIFSAFNGLEFCHNRGLRTTANDWFQTWGTLRLGYWRKVSAGNEIVYGLYFKQKDSFSNRYMASRSRVSCNHRRLSLRGDGRPHEDAWVHVFHKSPAKCLTHPYSVDEAPRSRDGSLVCSPQYARYRMSRALLLAWWRLPLLFIGVVCILTTTVNIVTGRIYRPIYYPEGFMGVGPDSFSDRFITSLVFNFLPGALFSAFNNSFLEADRWYRTMRPIRGMDYPAEAEDSILIDYISPNPISALRRALTSGHYRLAWYIKLAAVCTSTPIIAGKIFIREYHEVGYSLLIYPRNLHISLGVLCVYCVSLWFTNPPANYRATRPLFTLIDTISLCYDSCLVRCSVFDLPAEAKGKPEKFFYPTVKEAGYFYQFGMYLGYDCGRRHLGFDIYERTDREGNSIRGVDRFRSRLNQDERQAIWRDRQPRIDPSYQLIPAEEPRTNLRSGSDPDTDSISLSEYQAVTRNSSVMRVDAIDEFENSQRPRRVDTEMGFANSPLHDGQSPSTAIRATAVDDDDDDLHGRSSITRRPTR